MIYVVTRHESVVSWVRAQGITATHIAHLLPEHFATMTAGDRVIGNLPINLVADLSARGIDYQHVVVDLTPEQRGRELTPAEMDAANARLQPLRSYSIPGNPEIFVRPPPPRSHKLGLEPLVFFIGFSAVATIAFLMDFVLNRIGDAVRASLASIPATTKAVAAETTAVADPVWGYLLTGAAYLLAVCIAFALWKARGRILQLSMRPGKVSPKRVLIQGLSPLYAFGPSLTEAQAQSLMTEARVLPLRTWASPADAFQAEHGPSRPALGAWQQNLRAAFAHRARLENIVVICSEGDRGSGQQFPMFRELVEDRLADDGLKVEVARAPGSDTDFEDHDTLRRAIYNAITFARDKWGVSADDIAIDVTAGPKIFSITAAAATFNHALAFTYVNNAGVVTEFDATVTLGEFS